MGEESRSPRALTLAVALIAFGASGCVVAAPKVLGDQCDLSSDCDAPLVCALRRCRNQCAGTRDCALGLRCVRAKDGRGVCLLADETDCERNSDCPESLVCTMMECTNECAEDVDCIPGARCQDGSCVELAPERCLYTSDCLYPLVCDDGQCVAECRTDGDCETLDHRCLPHPTCFDAPCLCRRDCSEGQGCPVPGTVCTEEGYCERESVVTP